MPVYSTENARVWMQNEYSIEGATNPFNTPYEVSDDAQLTIFFASRRETLYVNPGTVLPRGGSHEHVSLVNGVSNIVLTEDDMRIMNARCITIKDSGLGDLTPDAHTITLPAGQVWPEFGTQTVTFPVVLGAWVRMCFQNLAINRAEYSWTPSETISASGGVQGLPVLKYIENVNTTVTANLDDVSLGQVVDREVQIYSKGAAGHKVELTGSATFNGSGHKCLNLPTAGAGAKFHVVSPTVISLVSLSGGASTAAAC